MSIMSVECEFDAPADDVWAIVSDFAGLDRWNPAVLSISSEGSGVGMLRVFRTAAGTVTEELLDYDRDTRAITYRIVSGSTMKVRNARLRISVADLGDARCRLHWQMFGEPDGVALADLKASTEARYLKRLEDLRLSLSGDAAPAS